MSSPGFLALDSNVNLGFAVSPSDQTAEMILGIAWLGTFYVIGMIWTTLSLIDRWRGPHGDGNINFFSVVAALLLSAPWPVVIIITAIV